MRTSRFLSYLKGILPLIALLVVPVSMPAFAQEQSGSGSTTQSTQTAPATQSGGTETRRESTTVTTQTRTQTPVENVTGVDPMWLIIGGAALLALLVIVALSMRGRSHDHVNTVHERTTVIKE